jgi:hypothetical protein
MDEIEKITKKVFKKKASLAISRLPPETRESFVKLAEQDFCDDYGMTLKFLYDHYERGELFEFVLGKHEYIEKQIGELQSALENKSEIKKPKRLGEQKNE